MNRNRIRKAITAALAAATVAAIAFVAIEAAKAATPVSPITITVANSKSWTNTSGRVCTLGTLLVAPTAGHAHTNTLTVLMNVTQPAITAGATVAASYRLGTTTYTDTYSTIDLTGVNVDINGILYFTNTPGGATLSTNTILINKTEG